MKLTYSATFQYNLSIPDTSIASLLKNFLLYLCNILEEIVLV